MTARRWHLPAAVVAALLIAEGAVWILRPDERLEPIAVPESSSFKPAELERARTYVSGQRLLGLGAIAAQGALLVLLVYRPPRRVLRRLQRASRDRVVVA